MQSKRLAKLAVALVLVLGAAPALAAEQLDINGRPSGNWSGYVASKSLYTGVGASWVVPELAATTTLMSDVAWVGIGGSKTKDLIQAGTHGAVHDGRTQYWAWYELLPAYQVMIPVDIAPGDTVEVGLQEITRDLWYLSFENKTTGQSYYQALEYRSKYSSAEWIEEMPNVYNKDGERMYAPLSEFGTIRFMHAYAVVDGVRRDLRDLRASAVSMVSKNNKRLVLAAPSEVAEDSSFMVTRSSAVPSPMSRESGKRYRATQHEIVWTTPK